ncbi:hypothetical protein ABH931_006172 [Streptacidiphilus sp. MAP12-33]|uniref:hypothetical protein n=1 Tax=Streptacidiphilus sp. MAP12-33 TaxID=3156266 RepID=UPI0035199BE8
MRSEQPNRPAWMPPDRTVSALPAGRWWDVVVVPQRAGLDALEVLDRESGHCPGPVIWDVAPNNPRLYFLVPLGTAATWPSVRGCEARGETTYIGVPGATTIEPPGVHWLCPPDPDRPGELVDAAALRAALELLAVAS